MTELLWLGLEPDVELKVDEAEVEDAVELAEDEEEEATLLELDVVVTDVLLGDEEEDPELVDEELIVPQDVTPLLI